MKRLSIAVSVLMLAAWGSKAGNAREVSPRGVVLQTRHLRLEIDADGRLKSLTASSSGEEYAWTASPMPIASVYRGGQMAVGSQEAYGEFELPPYRGGKCFPASAVVLAGDTLIIRFGRVNTV